jgi:hypothetical protein
VTVARMKRSAIRDKRGGWFVIAKIGLQGLPTSLRSRCVTGKQTYSPHISICARDLVKVALHFCGYGSAHWLSE